MDQLITCLIKPQTGGHKILVLFQKFPTPHYHPKHLSNEFFQVQMVRELCGMSLGVWKQCNVIIHDYDIVNDVQHMNN